MARILVTYYTRTHNTQKLAEAVRDGAQTVSGADVTLKPIDQLRPADLLKFDGIIVGSPTYYGSMASELKKFFDESVSIHGQLEGKVGGAFSTSANIGGGNETTSLDIIRALLIHGMVVPGSSEGDHYGPVAIDVPDKRALQEGQRLGRVVATLAVKLFE